MNLWRKLYLAAMEYQRLLPWKILSEDDLFALHDPISNKNHYCCVLGEAGEFLGLTLYRGREGLEMHLKIKENDSHLDESDLIELYDAIVVEFCKRKDLEKPDLKIVKSLGFEIPRHELHPHFRSHLPGLTPWFLSTEEVELLTLALQFATHHIKQCINDPNFIKSSRKKGEYLLYRQIDHTTTWETTWHQIVKLPAKQFESPPLDQEKIWVLKGKAISPDFLWEAATFLIPEQIIFDSDRPYFLRSVMLAEHDSGLIIDAEPVPSSSCPYLSLRNEVISNLEACEQLPSGILVRNANAFNVLAPILKPLGIKLELRPFLPAISQAQAYLATAEEGDFSPAFAGEGPDEYPD